MALLKRKKADAPMRRRQNVQQPTTNAFRVAFKRSRTIVGSTSNALDSVGSHNNLESARQKIHSLSASRRQVFSILTLAVLISFSIWLFIINFTASVYISVTNTTMSKSIDKSIYENVINDYLNQNPSSRFSFIMNNVELSNFVKERNPEVLAVSERNMMSIGETNFSITLRTPTAGWKVNGDQYYVDEKGVSFKTNYFAEPDVQVVDANDAILSTGTAIVSNRFLSFVGIVVAESRSNGYIVTQAVLPVNTTRQLEVELKDVKTKVKLSIDRPAGEQIEDMVRALRYLKQNNISPAYIDIRVSGKAFYK